MKKVLLYIFILSGIAFLLWTTYLWKLFKSNFAGSYPTAETWSIPARQEEVIAVIKQLKIEKPELDPPHKSTPNNRSHKYWYLENFYYSDTDEDVEIYLRPTADSSYTILGFSTIKQHTDSLTDYRTIVFVPNKDINRDYGYFENRKQLKKFEERILNPILKQVKATIN